MAARLAENYSASVSKVTLEEYRRAFGGPYIPDSILDEVTDRVIDEKSKMPNMADLRAFVAEEQTRENRKRQIAQQIAHTEPPIFRPNKAEGALYRYIYLSAGSRTQVSIAGYEEYALRVFGLDPDQLMNSFGNPIQGTLFGEPLPNGERWPQTGPLLPAKCYADPWLPGSPSGIGRSMPSAGRAMTPKEVFAQRKKAEAESARGAA